MLSSFQKNVFLDPLFFVVVHKKDSYEQQNQSERNGVFNYTGNAAQLYPTFFLLLFIQVSLQELFSYLFVCVMLLNLLMAVC